MSGILSGKYMTKFQLEDFHQSDFVTSLDSLHYSGFETQKKNSV